MPQRLIDSPNALELIKELDDATEQMMALGVDQVGSPQWQVVFDRQQRAFRNWRDYLYLKADEKPPAHLLNIA
ncbi:hypothetical protein N5D61_20525 [Pseudomonas sp. GD03842]|uniref:hypothetical protein n=1 Tax=unclassified Pseudomonas TaxID=196821 RepID=UPI000D34DDD1|nr:MULTISPECIES: hypothetical protein [unclassified Pseudomonas]MDH0748713.1 hypothetical protein [Pseudomonas sp. GD03842]RAU44363.1 hypothetical protein DBP26_017075 [Pseudomonas sp. RIT 409]RAU50990.1 hypothetical protein DBY65_021005 [Pseudomonas sp. RIT 412]